MAEEDRKPSAIELIQRPEQLRERVGVGPVASDGAQDFARNSKEQRRAQRCGGSRRWDLEDERKEGMYGAEIGGECGERRRRVRAARR